jgi:predicted DNA binding CopG/RHH family protein
VRGSATVFSDANALDWEDVEHLATEQRWKRLGFSFSGRILLVVIHIADVEAWYGNDSHHQRGKPAEKRAKRMPDREIAFSDAAESTDAELRRARRVGRPATGKAKQLIAIRIAPGLLAQLRRLAAKQNKPYQTLIHEMLEREAARRVA